MIEISMFQDIFFTFLILLFLYGVVGSVIWLARTCAANRASDRCEEYSMPDGGVQNV